ncbi:MAG: hypothetical protein AAGI38_24440 [Bacteroidota bacterium]
MEVTPKFGVGVVNMIGEIYGNPRPGTGYMGELGLQIGISKRIAIVTGISFMEIGVNFRDLESLSISGEGIIKERISRYHSRHVSGGWNKARGAS